MVVLYQPNDDVVENIQTYVAELEHLYILDNSSQGTSTKLKAVLSLPNVTYICYGENRGVGAALNDALYRAKKQGMFFLLTMDQDSYFYAGGMRQYIDNVEAYPGDYHKVLQFSLRYQGVPETGRVKFSSVRLWITSASLVNVDVAIRLGGWNSELFVDEVDSEICCRALAQGYQTILLNNPIFSHSLGEAHAWHFLWKTVYGANHSAVRKYYMIRNRIYLMRRYPWLRREYIRRDIGRILRIVFFEHGKRKKLWYCFRGFIDAMRGRYGKIYF